MELNEKVVGSRDQTTSMRAILSLYNIFFAVFLNYKFIDLY